MRALRTFLILFGLMSFFVYSPLEGKVVDRIVAVVNGEVITETELEEALLPLQAQYNQTMCSKRERKQKLKDARRLALEQLIEKKLVFQKALKEKIEIDETEVGKMVAEIKGRFPRPEKFQEWLEAQNLSPEQFKERLREQALIRKLINKKLRPGLKVSPEEVKSFYENNKAQFIEEPQVSLSYILIQGPPKREESVAETLVREVWKKIKEGVDFSLLAKEYSDGPEALNGGDVGFINLQKLPPELREIVEKMKVGEVSEVIRTPSGYNLIKLTGRKEARTEALSEIEDLIEERIFRLKLEEKYQAWLEELKEEAYIERK